ncbi:hypothetical protein C5B90_05205 [Haloferax sp. Atlit-12N]|uniref:hypothetical protein n=1 Tax=Haloferax sp. Atlit-12N TaxID=2077203 RepID=UPI000E21FEB8|nr:hypothetical protein [Haloferax sp. Atlit-12N]RDZ65750.1 hypothetical protein C5B90_05205 [Haloferax sp. Atlit-12N]
MILDTNYWISFKDHRQDLFDEFAQAVYENDIEVLFSYGNFIDLIKYSDQDELSEMIPSVVSAYIPPQDYTGNSYSTSTSPLSLIPKTEEKSRAVSDTQDFGDVKTLKYLFRISDWEGHEEYKEAMQYLKSVSDEYGEEYVKALLFDLESGTGTFSYDERGDAEVVSKVVQAKRIEKMDPNENLKYTDIADMEIITHAIITNCDILVIESKWKNVDLVGSIFDDLGSSTELKVLDELDEFVSLLQ